MFDITIIGGGVTGLLALASLIKEGFKNISIIDPSFHGGDLIQKYGSVQSNTPIQKTVNALKLLDPDYNAPSDLVLDTTAPLYIHTQLIQDFVKRYMNQIECIQDTVESLDFVNNTWNIKTKESLYQSKVVFLCQGANPKVLQCGISIIPLEEALNKDSLKKYLRANDSILVFGTSHSGTLILQNCEDLQIHTTAIYNKSKPFLFANEGEYDGIKEDAEFIAKRILNNEFKYVKLVSLKQIDKVLKASKIATKVIYAMGFESRKIKINENIDSSIYNKKTGLIQEGLWGFGIAYPSSAPDDIHVDVGIISFTEHILNQMTDVKKYLINSS